MEKKDTIHAKEFFYQSAKWKHDAPSYYEYSKLTAVNKTHFELTDAIRYAKNAVEFDKKNIPYRLLLARIREDLFYASFLNMEERSAAKFEYERLLEIDSTCEEAHLNLGRLLQEDFSNIIIPRGW